MFAARAGAKHVYAIDVSHSAQLAQRNVEKNNLEKTITVIQGRVNEIKLPVAKVDIIISMFHGWAIALHSIGIIQLEFNWLLNTVSVYLTQPAARVRGIIGDHYNGPWQMAPT